MASLASPIHPCLHPPPNSMSPSPTLRIKEAFRFISGWAALLVSAVLALAPVVADEPTHFTWTSAEDGNWSDATKWTNDQASVAAPVASGLAGYVVEFSVDGTYTATQDQSAGFLLH